MNPCACGRGLGGDVARGNSVAKPVNVGVVGLGEVAQVIHLPVLAALGDRFRLAAVCDASPTLLGAMGDRYGLPPTPATPTTAPWSAAPTSTPSWS